MTIEVRVVRTEDVPLKLDIPEESVTIQTEKTIIITMKGRTMEQREIFDSIATHLSLAGDLRNRGDLDLFSSERKSLETPPNLQVILIANHD